MRLAGFTEDQSSYLRSVWRDVPLRVMLAVN
jgi:hypothetical protein